MKCIKLVVLTVLIALFFACKKEDESTIEVLTVASYRVDYYHPLFNKPVDGYLVWDSSGKEFAIQYIQDFADKYEVGYEYVIRVRVVSPKEPKWDQISSSYYLLEIISKTKVDE